MSIEDDIRTVLAADGSITALIPSTRMFLWEDVSPEGITRDTVPAAFDVDGFLQPSILIRERTRTPISFVRDVKEGMYAEDSVVEIYVYQDRDYNTIDSVLPLIRNALWGTYLTNTLDLDIINTVPRLVDPGPLNGASFARQEWLVPIIQGG